MYIILIYVHAKDTRKESSLWTVGSIIFVVATPVLAQETIDGTVGLRAFSKRHSKQSRVGHCCNLSTAHQCTRLAPRTKIIHTQPHHLLPGGFNGGGKQCALHLQRTSRVIPGGGFHKPPEDLIQHCMQLPHLLQTSQPSSLREAPL